MSESIVAMLRTAEEAELRYLRATNASPLHEDSHLVPGVEENDAKAGEIFDVPRHEGKAVFKGRGSDHAIRRTKCAARKQPPAL